MCVVTCESTIDGLSHTSIVYYRTLMCVVTYESTIDGLSHTSIVYY